MSPANVYRRLIAADEASAVVELALVAPMLLALMIGSVEVGRYANYAIKTANAARAGAQYGAQNIATASDAPSIAAAALADAQPITGLSAASQTYCTCADGTADANCAVTGPCTATNHRVVYVRVDVTGALSSLFNVAAIPGIPAGLRSITLTRSAIVRVAE